MNDDFREFIKGVSGPATLAELTRRFMATCAISAEYRERALFRLLEQDLRKAINSDRDAAGDARLVSVPSIDPATGETARVYKQLDLFEREDYRRVWLEADAREQKARRRKRSLEVHHDARRWPDRKRLRDVIRGSDLQNGAA